MLSFSPRDVLDEILDLIESVSDGFPTYSLVISFVISLIHSYPVISLTRFRDINKSFSDIIYSKSDITKAI